LSNEYDDDDEFGEIAWNECMDYLQFS